MTTWLLFTYKVPNQPSARRVYVWRKLKGLGAILLHETAWVLPDTNYTREKLQWLATEVKDMEGAIRIENKMIIGDLPPNSISDSAA